jgi:putative OPT family oligopeptide transporter
MQDFKAGYILGGTPRAIQIVELIAVVVASFVMYFPLNMLYQGNIKTGGSGFGDPKLAAPQAGLMAALAQGIVGGEMAWPLVVTGAFLGVMLIMIRVRSPMLVAIGMYLPFQTTAAIFVGGVLRWITNKRSLAAGHNEAQRTRVENLGILVASGLIAGEALTGLVFAYFRGRDIQIWHLIADPSYLVAFGVMIVLGAIMVLLPLAKAGRPEDPAPPAAMM